MNALRYAQFCPLARAAEILGERWTLLVARELVCGPQRFSDLQRRLPGVSSSLLTERLGRLEEKGIVARRTLAPPAPAVVYELTEEGRAIEPVLVELARFGARFLEPPQPGDHLEPGWLRLGVEAFARRGPSPRCCVEVRIPDGDAEVVFAVSGGQRGTSVSSSARRPDATLRAAPFTVLGLATGALDPQAALGDGLVELEGDASALADFPALFELVPTPAAGAAGAPSRPSETEPTGE